MKLVSTLCIPINSTYLDLLDVMINKCNNLHAAHWSLIHI